MQMTKRNILLDKLKHLAQTNLNAEIRTHSMNVIFIKHEIEI